MQTQQLFHSFFSKGVKTERPIEPKTLKPVTPDMKKLPILFLLLCFLENTNAQVNPYGLDITAKGKVVFSMTEPNYNGNVEDPTEVKCDGDEPQIVDWRNVQYDFLTIVDYPDEKWTEPSNLDPSRVNDTTISKGEMDRSKLNPYWETKDSAFITLVYTGSSSGTNRPFQDEAYGLELSDELVAKLKIKLQAYVRKYRDVEDTDDAFAKLRNELSTVDTVIEKRTVYDYLVDKLVFYNYNENDQLMGVIGYHWSLGVEVDSLHYDEKGNLVYFSRETIGGGKDEYSIEYDDSDRVIRMTHLQSSVEEKNSFDRDPTDFETVNYTYDNSGTVNSKSIQLPDWSWYTCTFQRK